MRTRILACLVLLGACPGAAGELPVTNGLVLQLDASEQDRIRQSLSVPALQTLQHVDAWFDSSTTGSSAGQPVAERRPLFLKMGNQAMLRFDGKDDFLSFDGPNRLAPEITIFVLAAPKVNMGGFSALLSTAETGRNDYTSGINVDFGPQATDDLSVLNVESAGGSGFRDLLEPSLIGAADRPFGDFHVITVRSKIGEKGTEAFLDGVLAGVRERLESHIGLDSFHIGARLYSHDSAQPPFASGYFHGEIAQVLVYERALPDEERMLVEEYLLDRRAGLNAMKGGSSGHSLETLPEPPVAQVLVPGFSVQELPLALENLNNLRYRSDGVLVALGYDGRIHLLRDTDGDGLEDTSEEYWSEKTLRGPLGMEPTRPGDPRGKGVFVASKGKVSFFPDADGNDRADGETVVATGWGETFHGVDTLGLAIDPADHSIWFGLGCANFADGYQIDKVTGNSQYDIGGERGTIQQLSADFSTRETVCTGVRFTCALAFNRDGDLFATEQEGATWLPNGNPFDELLHIRRGVHYGFPPRHPKHLPDAIDQPAVFEYGPQHQSTVGMVFNEGVNGGPIFGPDHWEGDAIVCGEARGKLWHTRLVKTAQGYVAQNHLFACFGMLVVDACVTPDGGLLVACHGGQPDWGTGPAGKGKLFQIRYARPDVPQPVQAWAAAPDEFRIAFDRPLDPGEWREAREKVRIEAGAFVSAGDRFETMRPGYQAVRDQMASPRRWVDVLGLSLSQDRRTLILRVPRQTRAETYAVTLPVPEAWRTSDGVDQVSEMDVALTLNGLQADFDSNTIVIPHPSLHASREFTRGSSDHDAFFDSPGNSFRVSGTVDASNPFVPSVQPGSKLDWDPARDEFCSTVFDLVHTPEGRPVESVLSGALRKLAGTEITREDENNLYLSGIELSVPIAMSKIYLPWATLGEPSQKEAIHRRDVSGHWLSGKRLFFGKAACGTCHQIRGEGVSFGPDLTNLVHRDRDSVEQDLASPSAAINPDHAGHLVTRGDGSVLSGILHGSSLILPGGAALKLGKSEIASAEPSPVSLMPEGIWQSLTSSEQEDLMTYLLTSPLQPTVITRTDPPAPPARSLRSLSQLLPLPPAAGTLLSREPLRILLAAGDKDHGLDEHDYPLWQERWSTLLSLAEGVTVSTCMGFPERSQLDDADVAVFYSRNQGWDAAAAAELDRYQERGGGLVYIHYAVAGHKHIGELADRIGLAFALSKFRHGEIDLSFPDQSHPIVAGLPGSVQFIDETYWKMHGDPLRLRILGTSREEQEETPQLWTFERGEGRVFGCIPGHYMWTFDDPLYRLLLLRGICWAAQEKDIDRLSELCTIGARVAP